MYLSSSRTFELWMEVCWHWSRWRECSSGEWKYQTKPTASEGQGRKRYIRAENGSNWRAHARSTIAHLYWFCFLFVFCSVVRLKFVTCLTQRKYWPQSSSPTNSQSAFSRCHHSYDYDSSLYLPCLANYIFFFVSVGSFDFLVCNPPFFSSLALTGLNQNRATNATPSELVCTGGEESFVKQMIDETKARPDMIRSEQVNIRPL